MHRQALYVTYDLPHQPGDAEISRGAISFMIQGEVVRHEIGEFKNGSGAPVNGVRVTISLEDEENIKRELIEVPPLAQNVQVHLGKLPEEYRAALKSAA